MVLSVIFFYSKFSEVHLSFLKSFRGNFTEVAQCEAPIASYAKLSYPLQELDILTC